MASKSSSISQGSLDREDSLDSERGNANFRVDYNREAVLHETMYPASKTTATRGHDHIHQGAERRVKSSGNAPAQRAKPAIKDKRKLREKRRSTGMVQVMSTESTGDSLDEDETRRNTTFNETSFAEEDPVAQRQHNKSPSDLEADFEDNQDYDSTVSQSESNPVSIGVSGNSNFFYLDGQSPSNAGNSATTTVKVDKSSAGTCSDGPHCTESDEFSQPDDTTKTNHNRDTEDNDRTSLEKLLEQEKQEKQRLKRLLELREQRIDEIEKKLSALA